MMYIHGRQKRGFTFLEIMIVVVLIGIMFAVIIPNMAGPRQKMAIQSTARDLAAAGLLARQRAIVQRENTYLIFKPETQSWQMIVTPMDDKEKRHQHRNAMPYDREDENLSTEEHERELPNMITFGTIRNDIAEVDPTVEEDLFITFYPNGSCSGLAVQVLSKRGDKMTVDFDKSTGRPTAYKGDPKSFAQKLREMGLNPSDYGLEDDTLASADDSSAPGAGYYMSAGWSEDERVDYYKDAVERMLEKGRMRSEVAREGQGAYYREASRWGQ